MSRIWAVTRQMIAESIRTKVAVVFIAIIVILLPAMPFVIVGDGVTLKSRAQSFLAYSLGSVGFLLSVLTVFLACGTLAAEIRQKHIFMVVSKPIPRWQFFAGKWLGICLLNGVLLAISGLTVWGFTRFYIQTRPTFPEDRIALEHEVLTVRYGAKIEEPNLAPQVDERLRRLREEGRLDSISVGARGDIREEIRRELRKAFRTIGPGDYKDFAFRNLLVDRDNPQGLLYLRFKPTSPSGVDDVMFKAQWQAGDRNDLNTLASVREGDYICDRFHSEPIPIQTVNREGTLYVRIQNVNPRNTIIFEGDDSFEVLYDVGTFHWNLFRALAIIGCRLAFLAALGLLASTFLSFPVACMAAFLVFLVATTSGFLTEAVDTSGVKISGQDPLSFVGPFVRPVASAFLWMVPDFSMFDPVGTVVAGRVVPLIWVIQSLVELVVLKGLILGVLGSVIFTRRELAQVTT